MEIQALKHVSGEMTAVSAMSPATARGHGQAEVELFKRMLVGGANESPEAAIIGNVQKHMNQIDQALNGLRPEDKLDVQALNDPGVMLKKQEQLMMLTVKTDLIAKTAGAVAQAINKLVSMQ